MLDLDIGMNPHLCAPFQWDDARILDRGKVDLRGVGRARIPDAMTTSTATASPIVRFRGHPTRGAYFTRGTSRDRLARYTEEGRPYMDNMERL